MEIKRDNLHAVLQENSSFSAGASQVQIKLQK
jgi:hypothetical protein